MRGRITFPPWLWAPVILLVDFLSKRYVLAHIPVFQEKIRVLGDLLRFAYVRNPGSAMGLFPAGRSVLIAVSALASVFLLVLYLRSDPRQRTRRGALAAILGGALGNLVDRIFYDGLVVDFIDIGIGSHRFYTFNVADMGVTLGGCVLFLCLLRDARRPAPAAAPAPGGLPEESGES